jgi:hypothetical protein
MRATRQQFYIVYVYILYIYCKIYSYSSQLDSYGTRVACSTICTRIHDPSSLSAEPRPVIQSMQVYMKELLHGFIENCIVMLNGLR